jgi:hypothetical protein
MRSTHRLPAFTMFTNSRYMVVNEVSGRFYWAVFRASRPANRVYWGELIGSGHAYNCATAVCSAKRCR